MMAAAKRYWPSALALLLGFGVAVLFAPIVLATADWYRQWDEANNPPASIELNTVERVEQDALRITMLVTRHKDCSLVRMNAYSGDSLLAMSPADSFTRADGEPPVSYPVGISVISRPWMMRGLYGSKLAIGAYYECKDRVVKAPLLIGDVPEFKP